MSNPTVRCNPFVRRMTAESQFSHFDGDWGELERIVQAALDAGHYRKGDREILIVRVPPDRFWSALIRLQPHQPVTTRFAPRVNALPGEICVKEVVATDAKKQPAKYVEVILYGKAMLGEGDRGGVEADYHIITIDARLTVEETPTQPITMARNMAAKMGLPEGAGGSPREYTAEEWLKAVLFWEQHAMVAPTRKIR